MDKIHLDKETRTQTPKDGFVDDRLMKPVDFDAKGNYFKGNRKTITYTTNDPRITKPFTYGICALFLVIGIIQLLCKEWFLAGCFIFMSLFTLNRAKQDIGRAEEKFKARGQKFTFDSKEEAKEFYGGLTKEVEGDIEELKKTTFTKKNYHAFLKPSIWIYCIMGIATSLLLGIFVNSFLGIAVFILIILIGVLYFYIISKIVK